MTDLSPRTGPDAACAGRPHAATLAVAGRARVGARRRWRDRHPVPAGRRSTTTATSTRSASDRVATPIGVCACRASSTPDRSSRSDGVTDFVIAFNGVDRAGHYDGEPGGIFKECIPVVVHGRFDRPTRSTATTVEVKHSNEYVRPSTTSAWPRPTSSPRRRPARRTADARREPQRRARQRRADVDAGVDRASAPCRRRWRSSPATDAALRQAPSLRLADPGGRGRSRCW